MNKLKIKRLNSNPSSPCYLLSINDVQLLCDCADVLVDGDSRDHKTSSKLDPFDDADDVQWDALDAILISNAQSLVMLPYITELKDFRGKVLTPGPVLRLGKVLIDDLLSQTEQLSTSVTELARMNLPSGQSLFLRYNKDQADKSLSKVQILAYHEYVNLFNLMRVKCVASGYEIGGCNWILRTDTEKLAYISRSSLYSSFTMPIDFSEFYDVDVLIVGAVNTSECLPFDNAMSMFRTIAVQTLARGGHLLLPTLPCGLIYHLFEALVNAKDTFDGNLIAAFDSPPTNGNSASTTAPPAQRGGVSLVGKVGKCPLFFISPQAKASLAYANVSGEWLAADREAKLYKPESPFLFNKWIKNGQLVPLASLHETPTRNTSVGEAGVSGGEWPATPTVFLAGHPSCRLGAVPHLIQALSCGVGRQRPPPPPQQQQTAWTHLNSLVLVQSDEFGLKGLCGHEQLRYFLDPLGCGEDGESKASSKRESILGVPVRRLGVGLTAFWLPLRLDVSLAQLPQLLAQCATPKQALIVPVEVSKATGKSLDFLPANWRAIGYRESMTVQLFVPSTLPVHVEQELLTSKHYQMVVVNAVAEEAQSSSVNADKDPRRAREGSAPPAPAARQVALVEGRLYFRDGKYHLDRPKPDSSSLLPTSLEDRAPQSPKGGSCSPKPGGAGAEQRSSAAVATGPMQLLVKAAATGDGVPSKPLAVTLQETAKELVRQLTVSGVTGGQVMVDPFPPAVAPLLESFEDTRTRAHKRLGLLSPPLLDKTNIALIVFPNSSTSILLTENGSHLICQDEGTREIIRNSLLATSATKFVTVPVNP